MKITAKFLTAHGACDGQVKAFRKLFPRGATINEANVIKAHLAGQSLYWLIRILRGTDRADNIPYAQMENHPTAKAYYKVSRQEDRELTAAWRVAERTIMADWRKMGAAIRKLEKNRNLSPNELFRLKALAVKAHDTYARQVRKEERAACKVIHRKYAAQLRKLRKAKDLQIAKILFPHVMDAVALYEEQMRGF